MITNLQQWMQNINWIIVKPTWRVSKLCWFGGKFDFTIVARNFNCHLMRLNQFTKKLFSFSLILWVRSTVKSLQNQSTHNKRPCTWDLFMFSMHLRHFKPYIRIVIRAAQIIWIFSLRRVSTHNCWFQPNATFHWFVCHCRSKFPSTIRK